MSYRAEVMLAHSVTAIVEQRSELIEWVFAADDKVDEIDWKIELACFGLLENATEEAIDLVRIGTILKIITDIERVGDLSVDIARCAQLLEGQLGDSSVIDLPKIASIARQMFHFAIEGYARQELSLVEKVMKQEKEVEQLFQELVSQIFDMMKKQSDEVVGIAQLLIALHNIERIAGHSVNIATRVRYQITGKLTTHGKSS